MAVSKRWYISLTSTDAEALRSIAVSKKVGIAIISFLSILILLFIASLVFVLKNQTQIIEAQHVIEENQILKEKLLAISTEIDSILVRIRLMERWEDDIRAEKNLEAINKEIREMGIGGYPPIDTTAFSLSDGFNRHLYDTMTNLAQLQAKVEFNFETHKDLHEKLELRELLYQNTPSIYPTYGRISEGYGWRTHPLTKRRSFHRGLDISNEIGTPVYATADGVIAETGYLSLFGRHITISHKFGYQTKYAHLNKLFVEPGDEVKRGQIIATLGNSGRTTGPHLHYEVWRYGRHRNPYEYLNKFENEIVLSE